MLLVGAQVAIVGALVAVVYFTLLKPDDDSGLFGVEAPSERPRITQTQPRDRGSDDRERRRQSGDRLGQGAPSGVPSGVVAQPAGPQAIVPSSEPVSDESPADDQYQDTLARLLELAGTGG
jgi:hypothetical protein